MRNQYTAIILIVAVLFLLYCLFGLSLGWGFYFGLKILCLSGSILFIHGILRWYSQKYRESILNKITNILIGLAVISCLVFEGLIFSAVVINDTSDIDYLIVLGAGIIGDRPSLELKYRLDSAIEFIENESNLPPKIIVCGAKGSDEENTEAYVMEKYLLEQGIDQDLIIKEEQSTTTFENINYAGHIIQQIEAKQSKNKIAICTNDFHLFRAKLMAKNMGFEVSGISSRTPLFIIPNHHVREYFAIIKSIFFQGI